MIRLCAKMAAISMEISLGMDCAPPASGKKSVSHHGVSQSQWLILPSIAEAQQGQTSRATTAGSTSRKAPQATLSAPEAGRVPELTSPSTSTTASLLNSVQKTFKKETLKRALFKDISVKTPSRPKQQPLPKEELEYLEALKALKLGDKGQHELKMRMQQLDQSIHQKYHKVSIEQLSDMVQQFYIKLADSMEGKDSHLFTLSPTEKTDVLNFLESCVISRNHK